MLVTLGTNQSIGANSSHTYTYSPQSFQRLFIKFDDGANIAKSTTRVTVQIGSRTICNGVSLEGLQGLSGMTCGFDQSGQDYRIVIDFGSHVLLGNDNLYVTVSTVLALDAVDCSAIVDSPGEYNPLKLTEYSDNTFTSENVYFALCYANAGSSIDEDNYVCEVRTATESSAPSFISSNNMYSMTAVSSEGGSRYGILVSKRLPQTTTFNYSSSAVTDSILVIQGLPKSNSAMSKARNSEMIAKSTVARSLR